MKIRRVEAELFHIDRQTDGLREKTNLIVVFCYFINGPKYLRLPSCTPKKKILLRNLFTYETDLYRTRCFGYVAIIPLSVEEYYVKVSLFVTQNRNVVIPEANEQLIAWFKVSRYITLTFNLECTLIAFMVIYI
jgi:hypothetical protein